MGKRKINAEIEILFHPDLELDIKEVVLWYSLDGGNTWDEYYANKLGPKKYQISMFDLPENEPMEFYILVYLRDGRVLKVQKEGKNYRVIIREKGGSGAYRAQVRVRELRFSHRVCLICEKVIPDNIQCATPECEAAYCPICNRMLPPHSNYCPWDKKQFR